MHVIRSHNTVLYIKRGEFEIRLIPMRDEHLPLLYEWNTRTEVLYWCEGDDVLTNSEQDVRNIYGSISQKAHMFIIVVNGTPVGDCWLQNMNLSQINEEYCGKNIKRIDVTIYEKTLWGKGVGRQIIRMLLEFGFHEQKADLIFAITEDYNIRCQKCIERCGFTLERKIAHPPTSKGAYEHCYTLPRETFMRQSRIMKRKRMGDG